jgi:glycosyltransferase involved in cell wall biosynthesis
MADRVIAVSDYVARRKIEVDLIPRHRLIRIWNSRPVVNRAPEAGDRLRAAFGLGPGPVVVCACRAHREKGISGLLRAFDAVCRAVGNDARQPTLVYFGDGPALRELRELHDTLESRDRIVLAGYRADAPELLSGADVCVVPSLWQEAFGLAALEPMTYGIPVIASRVGGIPEIVVDGASGVLVEPGDEVALEHALLRLLLDQGERDRLGRQGLVRARTLFRREDAVQQLIDVFRPGLAAHAK